jgi:hypothetical protein
MDLYDNASRAKSELEGQITALEDFVYATDREDIIVEINA